MRKETKWGTGSKLEVECWMEPRVTVEVMLSMPTKEKVSSRMKPAIRVRTRMKSIRVMFGGGLYNFFSRDICSY